MRKTKLAHRETKLVVEEELTASLSRGWQLTKELRSGKVLIARLA